MNWYKKFASAVPPVYPPSGVGDRPRSMKDRVNLIKQRQKQKQQPQQNAPKEDGKGKLIDIKAHQK